MKKPSIFDKSFATIFFARLKKQLKMPQVYISALLLSVLTSANYFIKGQFFTGGGSSDLVMYFSSVPYILILVIPVLSYKSSFSIWDSFIPLSDFEKLLINFFGILLIYVISLIFLLPGAFLVSLFGNIRISQIFTSFLALIFYGSAIIALCLLFSKIFTSSILSLLFSILILTLFTTCHLFAIYSDLNEILSNFLRLISFSWHFDAASKSILDTRDLFFFLICTITFLFFANFIEKLKKGKIFAKKEKISHLLSFLVLILLLLNCTKYYKRFDLSKNKTYTPTTFSKKLLSSLSEPVKITYYCSSSLASLYPQIRDVKDFLTSYSSSGKNISFIVKNPDKDDAIKERLSLMGISPQQLRTVSSNSTEYKYVYSAIVIEYLGNSETIPFTMSSASLEYDIDGRLLHLVSGSERNVNIIIGNGMNCQTDYSYLIPWLSSQGFICKELNIYSNNFAEELSKATGILLIFGDGEIGIDKAIAIESYILEGRGNALFALSPIKVDIENSWYISQNRLTNLVELLENWGVYFKDEIAADISCEKITMFSEDNTQSTSLNYPQWIRLLPQENAKNSLTLFWPSPLELSENAQVYLLSSPKAYSYPLDFDSPESLVQTNPFLLEEEDKTQYEKQTLILGARIQGSAEGLYTTLKNDNIDLIVIPDQYFANSLMNSYATTASTDFSNFLFLTNALLKLNGEEDLALLQEKTAFDSSLYKIQNEEELLRLKNIVFSILFIIIPFVIIFGGSFAFFKRKKIQTR